MKKYDVDAYDERDDIAKYDGHFATVDGRERK